jgi:hypothetical protein
MTSAGAQIGRLIGGATLAAVLAAPLTSFGLGHIDQSTGTALLSPGTSRVTVSFEHPVP